MTKAQTYTKFEKLFEDEDSIEKRSKLEVIRMLADFMNSTDFEAFYNFVKEEYGQ